MDSKTLLSIVISLLLIGCAIREDQVSSRPPKTLITKNDYEDLKLKPKENKTVKVDYSEGVTVPSIEIIEKLTPEEINQRKFTNNTPRSSLTDLKRLYEKGAEINFRNENNETALINLMKGPFDEETFLKLEYLISVGAKVNFRGRSKTSFLTTPLDAAVYYSTFIFKEDTMSSRPFYAEKVIRYLIESGSYVSGADDMGRTPLHTAAKYDNFIAARILIEAGAEVLAKDYNEKTPLDYATSEEISHLLKEHVPPDTKENVPASVDQEG